MYKYIRNKVPCLKRQSEEMTLLLLYRYISLVITSIFYLLSQVEHSIGRQFFVIACISISSIIISYLYLKNEKSRYKILILALIETIGNTFILIPSGGLNSPYVWYSLNTILISCLLLRKQYCWINLFIYLLNSTCISYLILNKDNLSLKFLIKEETNLILSFILITAVIQQLSKHIIVVKRKSQKLSDINKQLKLANDKIKESMSYIMELYQTVHFLTSQQDKDKLIELIIEYTKKTTKTQNVIFMDILNDKCRVINENGKENQELKDFIKPIIIGKIEYMKEVQNLVKVQVDDNMYILSMIKTNSNHFGVLGIQIAKEDIQGYEIINQLNFISDLGAIVMEKMKLERVNERLIINEEQNRIADEIHDGVLQKLFGISCRLSMLSKKHNTLTDKEFTKDLNALRGSINNTMKDLRATVYGLSWKKDGANNFIEDISSYITETMHMNQVDIKLNVDGNYDILSTQQKKYFYRIICEGIGNSIRHGKSSYIEVNLKTQSRVTILEIVDNGIGFDINKINKTKGTGIGLKNIDSMANLLNAKLMIQSEKNHGSKITVIIPNNEEETRRNLYGYTVS